jgi:predicted transcriptional regulator
MPSVSIVEKSSMLNRTESIKYQLVTHCFIHKIHLSAADLEMLALLVLTGEMGLKVFCLKAHEEGVFRSVQTVRNSINRLVKQGLIRKTGISRKIVCLDPGLQIQGTGNVLLMFKFLSVEPYES